jgi:hypothetical protein
MDEQLFQYINNKVNTDEPCLLTDESTIISLYSDVDTI